jgi:hypothetical protein
MNPRIRSKVWAVAAGAGVYGLGVWLGSLAPGVRPQPSVPTLASSGPPTRAPSVPAGSKRSPLSGSRKTPKPPAPG